eukprot:Nk52_evm29s2011 gene=Nk52_evmTU29s2011
MFKAYGISKTLMRKGVSLGAQSSTSMQWLGPAVSSQGRFLHNTSSLFDTTKITMPALSPTMTEGIIVKWHKAEGEDCMAGDVLFEIETDKATMEVESSEDGVLAKIMVEAGKKVAVNNLVGLMVEEGDDWKNVEVPVLEVSSPAPKAEESAPPVATPAPAAMPSASKKGTSKPLGPAVKILLAMHNLEYTDIPATGPQGRLLKGDVLNYMETVPESQRAKPVVSAEGKASNTSSSSTPQAAKPTGRGRSGPAFTEIPLNNMRKVIAQRLTESKSTIPHSYQDINCCVDEITKLRKSLKTNFDLKMSVNDFIIRASALALKEVPAINSSLGPDGSIKTLDNVDISVAVATDGGLITPIVTSADGRGLSNINKAVKDLAGRARENKLKPHEFQGGSFSISNLGMFGIKSFSAVINPPQSCILAVGGTQRVASGVNEGGDAIVESFTNVKLSFDRRVVDEEDAAKWLQAFKKYMENPVLLM